MWFRRRCATNCSLTRLQPQSFDPAILDRRVLGFQRKVSRGIRRLTVPLRQCCNRDRFDYVGLELAYCSATNDLGDFGGFWVASDGFLVGGRL